MHILVIGASGGVGQQVVAQALTRGHQVSVLVRQPRPWPALVTAHSGDVGDAAAVAAAMPGIDAVISCVGMRRRNPANPWSENLSPPDLTSRAAQHIVAGMRQHHVPRVIAVSAAGVGESVAQLNGVMKYMLAHTMIGTAYADLARMEAVFATSGVEWLAPRPTTLRDGAGTGRVQVVSHFGTFAMIRRADVAWWMLEALAQPEWPHPTWHSRTPQISNG